MSATCAFAALLERFAEQHQSFLAEVAGKSFEALQIENRRLEADLSHARRAQARLLRKSARKPDLPAPPPNLDAFENNCLARLSEGGNQLQVRSNVSKREPDGSRPKILQLQAGPEKEPKALHATVQDDGQEHASAGVQMIRMAKQGSVHPTNSVGGVVRKNFSDASFSQHFSIDVIDDKERSRQKRRLRLLLHLDTGRKHVTPEDLQDFLRRRGQAESLRLEDLQRAFRECSQLQDYMVCPPERVAPADAVWLDLLVETLIRPGILEFAQPVVREDMEVVVQALRTTTVEEAIESATRSAVVHEVGDKAGTPRWESCVAVSVGCAVVLSLCVMGTSIDFHPSSILWPIIETVCLIVFIVEIVTNVVMRGWRDYLTGSNKHWSAMDCLITLVSFFEVCLSWNEVTSRMAATHSQSASDSSIQQAAGMSNALRILRIIRIVRLVKLLRSPFTKDLVNMLYGLAIGLPALAWVMVTFVLVLFTMGLIFRIALGPAEGQDLLSKCGNPDQLLGAEDHDPDCPLHYMFGEQFFPTVKASMFTTFRFMMGDFSTHEGNSLCVAFSKGYGDMFHVVFCIVMIFVYFGLFNIITAIFVDSTISGLKHNDIKAKQARQYERRFVKDKLSALVDRIQCLVSCNGIRDSWGGRTKMDGEILLNADSLNLTEEDFIDVMDDGVVKVLLHDLDIQVYNPSGMFDTFDPDNSGRITLPDMIQACMKLRGEPQKNDIIASWVAIRSLHEKFDRFQVHFLQMARLGMDDDLASSPGRSRMPCVSPPLRRASPRASDPPAAPAAPPRKLPAPAPAPPAATPPGVPEEIR